MADALDETMKQMIDTFEKWDREMWTTIPGSNERHARRLRQRVDRLREWADKLEARADRIGDRRVHRGFLSMVKPMTGFEQRITFGDYTSQEDTSGTDV